MQTLWPAARRAAPLLPGWAHVYFLPTALGEAALTRLHALLSPDERARARRYKVESARRTLIAAHGQMRLILAGYTQIGENSTSPAGLSRLARALTFEKEPRGKPFLPGSPLRFNLSHTTGGALLGVALAREIGVDIEPAARIVDYTKMAPRFFAPSEAAELLALPPAQQPAAFLRCWTRKEAYIKARGAGLAIPLDSFTVPFLDDAPAPVSAPDPGWMLYPLDPGPDFAAALAASAPLEGLSCWAWEID